MKLEMFPPGQAATRIIPKAMVGVMKRLKITIRTKVTAGRNINCEEKPRLWLWVQKHPFEMLRLDLQRDAEHDKCQGEVEDEKPLGGKIQAQTVELSLGLLSYVLN